MEDLSGGARIMHKVTMTNRKSCVINGVNDVLSFDIHEILLVFTLTASCLYLFILIYSTLRNTSSRKCCFSFSWDTSFSSFSWFLPGIQAFPELK